MTIVKSVKRLLLGSAAGLVAVTAGQAADLPVKAKAVEYVKVCSLYGAGFYYMPGTDLCLKIGGWVRAEASWGINGNSTSGIFNSVYNNRYTNNLWSRERGYITADARDMTPYGVARGYIAVGISTQNNGTENAGSSTFSSNRAYVQWAGFTAGQAVSYFDYFAPSALMIRTNILPTEDTGDAGWWVWAYTAQFGGGISATLSAEERRMSQIIGLGSSTGGPTTIASPGTNGVIVGSTTTGNGYGGWQSPDIVANLRADETWGGAQIMGALHQVNPGYYGNTPITSGPSGTWGWVVGAGLKINFPMIAQGDFFMGEVNYTQGATRYLWQGNSAGNQYDVNGADQAWGIGSDCVFGSSTVGTTGAPVNATSCQLTTAWEVDAGYDHYWTPQWHQSLVGAYMAESYNQSANAMLCVAEDFGTGAGSTAVAHPGCNNNWSVWGVSSRLQWDVTKTFYLAAEAMYENLDTAKTPTGALTTPITLTNSGASLVSDEHNWTFTVRMHKDFYP